MGYLAGALLLTAVGQLGFKAGITRSVKYLVVVGLTSLAAAMVCTLFALRTLDIGLVFMATGLTHVLVLSGSRWLLHETIPPDRWLGAAVIISGVLLYGIASL